MLLFSGLGRCLLTHPTPTTSPSRRRQTQRLRNASLLRDCGCNGNLEVCCRNGCGRSRGNDWRMGGATGGGFTAVGGEEGLLSSTYSHRSRASRRAPAHGTPLTPMPLPHRAPTALELGATGPGLPTPRPGAHPAHKWPLASFARVRPRCIEKNKQREVVYTQQLEKPKTRSGRRLCTSTMPMLQRSAVVSRSAGTRSQRTPR
ncbi:hypothetical protein DFH08DRAFT_150156 [Mycena albidolilacea]|uniref:Uncharacterized protein n=1 Tax=Mycena albidolilacea TaxID=1033008 RepID=A0AAD7A2Z0_9AGAR|nr:hypothetical protein DFH08DRAFT_150156 [Mycena albidolilacea]